MIYIVFILFAAFAKGLGDGCRGLGRQTAALRQAGPDTRLCFCPADPLQSAAL
jgi:hypothetical protein